MRLASGAKSASGIFLYPPLESLYLASEASLCGYIRDLPWLAKDNENNTIFFERSELMRIHKGFALD